MTKVTKITKMTKVTKMTKMSKNDVKQQLFDLWDRGATCSRSKYKVRKWIKIDIFGIFPQKK